LLVIQTCLCIQHQISTADAFDNYGSTAKTRAIGVGLRYANGPALIAATFDNVTPPAWKQGNDAKDQNAASVKQWNVGGTYDFKVVKVHGAYGQNIDGILEGTGVLDNFEDGGDQNSGGGYGFLAGARTTSWMAGLSAPVGAAGSVFLSWQQMAAGGSFKDLGYTATQNVGSVGYTYSLSKRTNLYAYYSYMSNVGMLSGAQSNSLGVGVRHLF
jgi:GBP family porin